MLSPVDQLSLDFNLTDVKQMSVISSDKAGSFYPKLGFRVECHTALEVGEKFSDEEEVWVWFLVRDRVGDLEI